MSDILEVGAGSGVGDEAGRVGTADAGEADQRNGVAEPPTEDLLVREGDIAGDYLERLLDLLDYDGDIDLDVEASRAIVSIDGGEDLQKLVGPHGQTLEALQELTRLAVVQQTGVRSRLMLDIGGYRARRKVVHDAISAIDGVRSESEGEEPDRRVVVLPD